MALQHQTTQRSPTKEHFGYACESQTQNKPHTGIQVVVLSMHFFFFLTRPVNPIIQDPQMLDQLAKNITRCGLSNSTLNYLRVSKFRF